MTLIIFHLFHSFFILLHKEGEEEAVGVAISDSECSLIGGAFANGNLAELYRAWIRTYVRARERVARHRSSAQCGRHFWRFQSPLITVKNGKQHEPHNENDRHCV